MSTPNLILYPTKEEYYVIRKYITGQRSGAVIVSPYLYKELSTEYKDALVEAENWYDFGGDCDVAVDVITSDDAYIFCKLDSAGDKE